MRTETKAFTRSLTTFVAAGTALSALAQGAAPTAAPTAAGAGMPMEVNYVLLGAAILQMVFIVGLSGVMRTLIGPSAAWMQRLRKGGPIAVLLPLLLFSTHPAQAQAYTGDTGKLESMELFWWLVAINIFLFIILMLQLALLRGMTGALSTAVSTETGEAVAVEGPTAWQRMMRLLTRRVEAEREQDVLMHHDYDGIQELDNVLPPWWLWLFYGSIIWGVVYLVNLHVINIWPDQKTLYTQEMDQAKTDVAAYMATLTNLVDENNVTENKDAAVIASGKGIFTQYCVACHMANGEGNVGPNLTDVYWLHGGGIKNIFKTIKYGVPEKGMISWQSQLKPAEIQAVASYILSLQGSNPPNAKAPQGDPWTGDATASDTAKAAVVDSAAIAVDTTKAGPK